MAAEGLRRAGYQVGPANEWGVGGVRNDSFATISSYRYAPIPESKDPWRFLVEFRLLNLSADMPREDAERRVPGLRPGLEPVWLDLMTVFENTTGWRHLGEPEWGPALLQ